MYVELIIKYRYLLIKLPNITYVIKKYYFQLKIKYLIKFFQKKNYF